MATTATLADGFEYVGPSTYTLERGYIYGFSDFLKDGFEYVESTKKPKFFTFLIDDG
jgi:hypothetical protein